MADERPATPPLQGRAAVVGVTLVAIAVVAGTAWGFGYAGPLGALLGMLIGIAMGTVAFTIVRASATTRRFDERPAPDVRELPPDQAMQVLTALMNAGAEGERSREPMALAGGVLAEIAKARARASAGDRDGALAQLRALAEDHPRVPAVPAEIARVLAQVAGREPERLRAAADAIGLAIRGGMNRVAAQVFDELDELEREALTLEPESWDRLAKIFGARGDEELAALCSGRAPLA